MTRRTLKTQIALGVLLGAASMAGPAGIAAAYGATRAQWAACADTRRQPAAALSACARILAERRLPTRNRAMAHNNRCHALSVLRRYRAALADCNRAARLDPRNRYVFGNRGRVHFRLGQYDLAIADLTRALQRSPGNYDYRFTRGRAYLGAKNFKAAIADYDRLIKANPRQAAAFNNRGVAYRGIGQSKKALADFERAVSLKADYGLGLINLGFQIWRRDWSKPGGFERAVETISMGLRFEPKNAHGYYLRGKVRAERFLRARSRRALSRPAERSGIFVPSDAAAAKDLRHALTLNPRNVDAYVILARLARARKEVARAIVNLDMAVRLAPDNTQARLMRADAYLALGDATNAIPDLSRAIGLLSRPSNKGQIGIRLQASPAGAKIAAVIPGAPADKAGLKAGDTITRVGATRVAGLSARRLAQLIGGRVGASVRLRIERPGAPKPIDRALVRADVSSIYNPTLAAIYRKRGDARFRTGDFRNAEKDFATALRLHPDARNSAAIRRQRGHALGRLGDTAAAIESYYAAVAPFLVSTGPRFRDKALETDGVRAVVAARLAENPKDIRALWVRSVTRGRDLKSRLSDYSRIVDLASATPGIFRVRGEAYALSGNCPLALSDFDRAAQRRPRDPAVFRGRGQCHWKLGSVEAAIADFRRAVALKPDSMLNLRLLLAALQKSGRKEEALAALDAAKGSIGDPIGTLDLWQAGLHEKAGRLGAAIAALDRYVSRNPTFARAYGRRGGVKLKAKDYAGAVKDLTKAIELAQKRHRSALPGYYSQRGRAFHGLKRYDLAVRDFSAAIERRAKPAGDATLTDLYRRALAHYARKQTAPALVDLARVVAARPKFAEGWNMRAWLLWESGRAAEGLPEVEKALALAPDNPAFIDTRAHIYEAMGRTEEAIADYRRALKLKPDQKESREGLRRLTKQTPK